MRESAVDDLVIMVGLARRAGTNRFNTVLVIQRGRVLGFYDKYLKA
jgi:predicted amidohydrolase